MKIWQELVSIVKEVKNIPEEWRQETIDKFMFKFQIKKFIFVSDDDQANIDDWALIGSFAGEVIYVYEIKRGKINYQLFSEPKGRIENWFKKKFFALRFFINLSRYRRAVAEFEKMMLLR